jgi:hypothetical protein
MKNSDRSGLQARLDSLYIYSYVAMLLNYGALIEMVALGFSEFFR